MNQIVYSSLAIANTDGKQLLPKSTYALHFLNLTHELDVQIKLNDGPHTIIVPSCKNNYHQYVIIPGNYGSFQVLTAGASVAVFAVG
jgi:hypothetical protein